MKHFLLFNFLFFPYALIAQLNLENYFDGNDTISSRTIEIDYRSDTLNNIWQIGRPQKTIFNTASTIPNAIVTDTINFYPNNDTSSFIAKVEIYGVDGIFALQWMQKLDYDTLFDGGKIEFSVDSGITWENALNSPYNYNFYGFNEDNLDTLHNGDYVFTGTDTTWRNVWLCYGLSWLGVNNNYVEFKFTSISDGVNNNNEGWLIDNLYAYITYVHTTINLGYDNYLNVFPNPAQNRLNIDLKKQSGFHIIKELKILNSEGVLIESFKNIPTRFFIDTKNYKAGCYYLNVKTNIKSETIKFIIND